MKIEKILKNLPFKDKCIDIKKLKKLTKSIKNEKDQENFEHLLEEEIDKFYKGIETEYAEITSELEKQLDIPEYELLKEKISMFFEFSMANIMAIKKIIHKYKKSTGRNLMKNHRGNLKNLINSIDNLKNAFKKIDEEEIDETNFEKFSNSYWITPGDLLNLKLTLLNRLNKVSYVNNAQRLYDSVISSVYLDNVDFSIYNSYFNSQEETFFIRLRWYGTNASIVHCEMLFLNDFHKNHKSVSLKIPEKLVTSFLNGNDIWEYLKDLGNKREVYTAIQTRIVDLQLRPMVRTFFKRSIFENEADPSLKVYLDSNIVFIKECLDSAFTCNYFPLKDWRRSDIEYNWPFKNLPISEISRFPFSVLKIVRNGNLSPSNENLTWLKSCLDNVLIDKTPNFSKFVHGCGLLFPNIGRIPESVFQMARIKLESENTERDIQDALVHFKGESELSYDFSHDSEESHKHHIAVKAEPKAFFANERTFLNWIEFGIYVGGVGTALVSLGNLHSYMFGVLIITCTVIFSVYVLYLYNYRAIHIRLRHAVPYDDYVGAALLIFIFMIMIMVGFIIKFPIRKNGIN